MPEVAFTVPVKVPEVAVIVPLISAPVAFNTPADVISAEVTIFPLESFPTINKCPPLMFGAITHCLSI